MTLGVIPNPQFVGLRFTLVDNPAYDQMDGRGIKLYVKLRRFIWRKETGPLGTYFENGHLATDGYLNQWAEWLGVAKSTVSRILNQLEEAGWIKWVVRSSKGGQPNIIILGRWIAVDDERIETYFVDTLSHSTGESKDNDTVAPVEQTVAGVEQSVAPVEQTVAGVQPSNREPNRETNRESIGADKPPPPEFFSEQFSTSVKEIKTRKHTRSEWEAILQAEIGRGEKTRSTLVEWVDSKLHGTGHPAIQAYRDEMGHYPRKNQIPDIIQAVGENGNLELFKQIVHAWKMTGWNPFNLAGMLDCLGRGEVPNTNGGNGNGKRSSNRTTILARGSASTDDPNTPTPEEAAALKAALRAHRASRQAAGDVG